jgi:tetratricopeptide (TPR) repeat protein
MELEKDISIEIENISEQGNELFDNENYLAAIKVWEKALALIPIPQNMYCETLWLEASIGDAYFMLKNNEEARIHFENAKGNLVELAYENPFIMLRLGQIYLNMNDSQNAKEYLLRAYLLKGEDIFLDEDPAYFKFLKETVLNVE